MPFRNFIICLTVKEEDADTTNEYLLSGIDSLVKNLICVYNSEISSIPVDVPDAAEIERDMFGDGGS